MNSKGPKVYIPISGAETGYAFIGHILQMLAFLIVSAIFGDPSEIRTPDTLIKSLPKMVFPVLCCAFFVLLFSSENRKNYDK